MPKVPATFTNKEGFTLIELLVSIAILLIISLLVIFSLTTFGRQVEIEASSQSVISVLSLARNRTLASEGKTTYGVHFDNDKYVLFSGSTYTAGDPNNDEYDLQDSEFYSISLNGGGNEVIFDRIRGTTGEYGSVSLRLISDNNQSRTINISESGQAGLSETLTVADSRVYDSRHLHFDLGWSIQNKNTLTLNFPNDSVTQNINMTGFFNVGKTEFDWAGTVNVSGSDQVLRVHTHSLDGFNTILSIERDKRYNDKALTVSIDGQQIVSYTAAGVATVGSFGGVLTVQ